MRYLLILLIITSQASYAYLDTTPKNFQRPQAMKVQAYNYTEPEYQKQIDLAAEKVAPQVFGVMVTGPAGTVINVLDKAIKLKEEENKPD